MRGGVMIIGPGRVGRALGAALAASGEVGEIVLCGRHPDPPDAPPFGDPSVRYVFGLEHPEPGTHAVILTVPEAAVPEVAHAVAALGPAPEGCVALHTSGALPTDVLEPLFHAGYPVGAFHPLVAVTARSGAQATFAGAWVSVTGAPETVTVARVLATWIGAHLLTVPAGRRALYHAAAVLGSTMMLPLLARSADLMQRAGVDGDDALAALLPLVRSTLDAIEGAGVPEALRGPIARGDVETVALHLRALEPDEARLYSTIALEAVRLSEHLLQPDVVEQLTELFGRHVVLETTESGV